MLLAVVFSPSFPKLGNRLARADAKQWLWAGHQVLYGEKKVPFLGRLETQSDYFVLAKVQQSEAGLSLVQQSCKATFKKVGGVQVSMTPGTLERLPPARIAFTFENGQGKATPWKVGWNSADLDRDGHPGVSIRVDSAMCRGQLYVASQTTSRANARPSANGMQGTIRVTVKQQILGADSVCLKWFSSDSEQRETGAFAYRRVPDNATCQSLLKERWPVRATPQKPNNKRAKRR